MKKICAVVTLILASVVPATAVPITWFDSGLIDSSADSPLFPGLTVGTPWSLEINFDSNAPGSPGFPSTGVCNTYPLSSTTLTLGSHTYTASGGQIWTNSNLPGSGCGDTAFGGVQFEWATSWTQEPGAWDLNGGGGLLIATYTDLLVVDGSLPTVPTVRFSGDFGYYVGGNVTLFQEFNFTPAAVASPAPVPEPGTLGLLGIGLAYLARRRLRQPPAVN